MPIQWDRSLAVGVKIVDEQHQELFRRIDALMSSMMKGQGKPEAEKLLAFLGTYVDEHFGAEERLMAKHAYPGQTTHKLLHSAFVRSLRELQADVDSNGVTGTTTITVNKTVNVWLREHIAQHDKAFGKYLATAGVAEAV